MNTDIFYQYVWLIDTVRSAGQISKHDIDLLWSKCWLNTKREKVYPVRSFHRHREYISEIFGIYIGCERENNLYYISNIESCGDSLTRIRMMSTVALSNVLSDSIDLRKRVLFDDARDGSEFLPVILSAMRDKRVLHIVFTPEKNLFPVAVVPYCLKERKHQWYLAAKSVSKEENVEVQVFCLSDVDKVFQMKEKSSMPRWFKGDVFFDAFFEHADAPKKSQKGEMKPKEKPAKKAAPKKVVPAKEEKPVEQLSLF